MTQSSMIADRYEVLAELGRGGMGVVARAFDHRLQTEVALKILRRDLTMDSAQTDSLLKEGRVLARLTHPSVVRLFDLAETELGLMLVLEYVRGPNLSQVLKARLKLTETELLFIMRQICSGLDAAHAEGIIHRDLKPPNLLVATDSDSFESFKKGICTSSFLLNAKVKITDFGISKLLASRAETNTAGSGIDGTWSSAGTPLFMSPEQFLGQPSTPETDIYALGVVAYQAIAGVLPFYGDSVEALQNKHLSELPQPIAGCSPHISQAILRALSKRPEDRFPSARAFLAALEGRAEPPASLPSLEPDSLDNFGMWVKSHLLAISMVCASLLGLLLLALSFVPAFLPRHQAAVANAVATESVLPDLGKRLTLPEDMDVLPELKALPPPSPSPVPPVSPGPHKPRVAWTALIDSEYELEPWVDGVGPDGTIYVREARLNTLWAIRDQALAWSYRGPEDSHSADSPLHWDTHADFRDPGRMWLAYCPDVGNKTCHGAVFNAAGGGRVNHVPATFGHPINPLNTAIPFREIDGQNSNWPESSPRLLCVSRLNAVTLTDAAKRWSVPLDGRAALGMELDNGWIVSTAHGMIYALTKDGQVQFTYKVAEAPDGLLVVPSGDLVILEKERQSFMCVRGGRLLWKFQTTDTVAEFKDHIADAQRIAVADSQSTLYFLTSGQNSSTVAIDRDGKLLWKLSWGDYVNEPGLALDSLGRLFYNFSLYQMNHKSRGGIICIADK